MKYCKISIVFLIIFGALAIPTMQQTNPCSQTILNSILQGIFGSYGNTASNGTCPPCPTSAPVICPVCTTPAPVTCPPPPPPVTVGSVLPCGSILQYSVADPSPVINNGVVAGQFPDGTNVYVGVGINYGCSNEYNCPGRLRVSGSGQGVYMSCQGEIFDGTGTRFVVAHPNMKWVKQTTFNATNLVTIKSNQYQFYFGRTNITKADGTYYTIVSKVFPGGTMLQSVTGAVVATTNIEVLSC